MSVIVDADGDGEAQVEVNECSMLEAMCIVAEGSYNPIRNHRGHIDCFRSASSPSLPPATHFRCMESFELYMFMNYSKKT